MSDLPWCDRFAVLVLALACLGGAVSATDGKKVGPATIDQTDPEFWSATLDRVADLRPEVYRAGALRLLRRVRLADARQAIYLLQKARNLYPDDPRVLADFALACLTPYRWTWDRDEAWVRRAAQALERAAGQAPDLPEVRRARGLLHMLHGRLAEAEREFRVALAADAEDLEALLLLGAGLRLQDRYREAYDTFDRAVALDPADWRGYAGMGDVYRDDRWYEEALSLYRKGEELNDRAFPPRFGMVTVYQRTGFPTLANKLQVELLRDFPEFSDFVLLSGAAVHMQVRKYEAALEELEQISFGGSRGLCDGSVTLRIGLCRMYLGNRKEAARAFRTVIDEYPEARDGSDYGPLAIFAASRNLGRIYQELGRPDDATEVLEAASLHPEAPLSIQLHLSQRYSSYGLHDRAAEVLRRGLEGERPGAPRIERLRARVDLLRALTAAGRRSELEQAAATLDEIAPEVRSEGQGVDHYLLARGFALAGREADALEWLARAVESGYHHFQAIRSEPDLASIRDSSRYREMMRGR